MKRKKNELESQTLFGLQRDFLPIYVVGKNQIDQFLQTDQPIIWSDRNINTFSNVPIPRFFCQQITSPETMLSKHFCP